MAELVDALCSGRSAFWAWEFESLYPHQILKNKVEYLVFFCLKFGRVDEWVFIRPSDWNWNYKETFDSLYLSKRAEETEKWLQWIDL